MTDISDRASEHEETDRADALAAQAQRAGFAGKTLADSAVLCRVCDEPIPDERRQAYLGVQTCVLCQAELEQATKTKGWAS